jgi:hypothetical protein
MVLPAGSAPAQAGLFIFHHGKTLVQVNPGVRLLLNGKAIRSAELAPEASRLQLGDLTLSVHLSGDRYAIRLRDKNSAIRKHFRGTQWFPVDPSYRITARYVPYNPPKSLEVQNALGDFDKTMIVGMVIFSLHGQQLRLDAETDETPGLFLVFRDLTSGKQTYPASRFLHTVPPRNGMVVLDFNEAYNPPCAYDPYTTCPLPPPGNRLRVAIQAGEKSYRHDPAS